MSVKNHIRSRFSIDFSSKSLPKPTCESMANFEDKFRRSSHRSTKRCCRKHCFTYVKPHSSRWQRKSKLDRATRKIDETIVGSTFENQAAQSASTKPFRTRFRYQTRRKNFPKSMKIDARNHLRSCFRPTWVDFGRFGRFFYPQSSTWFARSASGGLPGTI